jgi:hypothetical protein
MLARPEPGLSLAPRWTPLRHHPVQRAYSDSPHRFNALPAGRRSGKTERAKRKLVIRAMTSTANWDPRFFAAAPTRDQAKRIYWDDLKAMTKSFWRQRPSESELIIPCFNAAEIHVLGMDKPERVEGSPWDGGVLDEYANMKEHAWGAHVRPALSDRKGWCDFIGVPEGRNHYYEISMRAQSLMREYQEDSEWGYFHWKSSDILDAQEIESAKASLDPLTYAQEYEGSFVNFEGRAYYPFLRDTHCAPLKYDPRKPLVLCFDFNVEPGVCGIIQEQELPGQFVKSKDPAHKGGLLLDSKGKQVPIFGTGVIAEVHIPRNSSTPAVCNKILEMFGGHVGMVIAYGDATGGARGTAKVMGSDWDLISAALKSHYKERYVSRVKQANPRERARVNAVNTRCVNGIGEIHLMVDPVRAPNVVRDMEGVVLLKGGSGEIDKKHDPKLSHVSDAIGYYCDYEFPVAGSAFRVAPLLQAR